MVIDLACSMFFVDVRLIRKTLGAREETSSFIEEASIRWREDLEFELRIFLIVSSSVEALSFSMSSHNYCPSHHTMCHSCKNANKFIHSIYGPSIFVHAFNSNQDERSLTMFCTSSSLFSLVTVTSILSSLALMASSSGAENPLPPSDFAIGTVHRMRH